MKKALGTLLAMCMLASLVACGGGTLPAPVTELSSQPASAAETPEESSTPEEEPEEPSSMTVDITLPAVLFEGEARSEELTEEDIEAGIIAVVVNEDGSVTYSYEKEDYDAYLARYRLEILDSMEEVVKESGSFTKIELSDAMDEATIYVDKSAYNEYIDPIAAVSIYYAGWMYQLVSGVEQDAVQVSIYIVAEETGEELWSALYPDDFNA